MQHNELVWGREVVKRYSVNFIARHGRAYQTMCRVWAKPRMRATFPVLVKTTSSRFNILDTVRDSDSDKD